MVYWAVYRWCMARKKAYDRHLSSVVNLMRRDPFWRVEREWRKWDEWAPEWFNSKQASAAATNTAAPQNKVSTLLAPTPGVHPSFEGASTISLFTFTPPHIHPRHHQLHMNFLNFKTKPRTPHDLVRGLRDALPKLEAGPPGTEARRKVRSSTSHSTSPQFIIPIHCTHRQMRRFQRISSRSRVSYSAIQVG